MSNFRSLAVVTATLERMLQDAANKAVQQTDVRIGAPTVKLAEEGKPVINLFLFRALPSAAHRNDHFPTRSGNGALQARSRLALDLHYVLSFYGDAAKFEPERLFGAAALALEDAPGLSVEALAAAEVDNANQAALKDADLAKEQPLIRLEPDVQTLEEVSKLWSVFFQVPYALSASYVARHIVIETQDDIGAPIPVTSPELFVAPMGPLSIETAGPAPGRSGPVPWGGTLHLSGRGIAHIGNSLRIDGVAAPLAEAAIVGEALALPLNAALFGGTPPATGYHQLQLVAAPANPAGPEHIRRGSNSIGFAILPVVTMAANAVAISSGNAVKRAGTLTVTIAPPLQAGQVATALLNIIDNGLPGNVAIEAEEPAAFPASQLKYKFSAMVRGRYLLRVDVDGLATLASVGTDPALPDFGRITGPLVDLS